MPTLPYFEDLWNSYPKISGKEMNCKQLKRIIKGHMSFRSFVNCCSIRVSYSLNESKHLIADFPNFESKDYSQKIWRKGKLVVDEKGKPKTKPATKIILPNQETVEAIRGKKPSQKLYIRTALGLKEYLISVYGSASLILHAPFEEIPTAIKKKTGIIWFDCEGEWGDAGGHITLWDGSTCIDKCYFKEAKEIRFWIAPTKPLTAWGATGDDGKLTLKQSR